MKSKHQWLLEHDANYRALHAPKPPPEPPALCPDGVPIEVKWDEWTVGLSIFVPCIDAPKAVKQVLKKQNWSRDQIRYHVCRELHLYGVRIWRVK